MLALVAALLLRGLVPGSDDLASQGPEVGFIHVEANVDAAAGGHAALRVGPHVYHFLQTGDRVLRLTRVDWAAFVHVYAGLKNRSLHVYYLDLARDDAERLALSAARAWIDQEREDERVRRRASDAAWWAALRDGVASPPLPSLGLLGTGDVGDAAGIALRDALRDALGDDFAGERLRWLAPVIEEAARSEASLVVLRERLTEREVVRAIERAAPLDPAARIDVEGGTPLTDAERRSLELYLDRLRQSAIDLWDSPRPDRGRALAVAAARHHAVARSLAEGRLVLLDAFPDDARVTQPDADEAALAFAPLRARARDVLATMRAGILDGALPSGPAMGRLEWAATLGCEAERGARGESVRLASGRGLPARGRAVARLPVPEPGVAETAAARADAAWREAESAFRARFGYSLLDRNCATELVRLMNDAFTGEDDVRRALGAYLVPGDDFAFIPRVLAGEVEAGLRLRAVEVVRSRLRSATDQLERDGAGAWTMWGEATAWTSTIYTRRAADGWFLFFTDESVWNRPLLGSLNLTYGLLRGVGGLFTWPFDGGEDLRAGFHGAFYSLPELFFFNVRKGTFAFVDFEDTRSAVPHKSSSPPKATKAVDPAAGPSSPSPPR